MTGGSTPLLARDIFRSGLVCVACSTMTTSISSSVLPSTCLDLNVWALVTCVTGRGNRDDLPPSATDAETKKLLWQTHTLSEPKICLGRRQMRRPNSFCGRLSVSLYRNYRSNQLINSYEKTSLRV